MHLHNQYVLKNGKRYDYYSVVESYRKDGKNMKRILFRLGRLTPLRAQQVKNVLKATTSLDVFVTTFRDIIFESSSPYLELALLNHLWDTWDLSPLFSTSESKDMQTADIAKVLTLNRCLDPGSNLYAAEWFKETVGDHILGIDKGKVNDSRIYRELREIEKKKPAIELHLHKTLKERNNNSFRIVFYDLTDSYFEGTRCELAKPGRTKANGFRAKKIVLSLLVNSEGYPFSWDILTGDTVDVKTIKGRVDYCKKHYGIVRITLVFDRGMVSEDNLEYIDGVEYKYITTLNKNQIAKVPGVVMNLFASRNIEETVKQITEVGFAMYDENLYYQDLGDSGRKRYLIGFNPPLAGNERKNREERIQKGVGYLKEENKSLSEAKGSRDKKATKKRINEKLGKLKVGSYLPYHLESIIVTTGKRKVKSFRVIREETDAIEKAKRLDGVCVFVTNHLKADTKERMDARDIIAGYRDKNRVEEAFRNVKSFIKFQPVYLRKEVHVRAHYTICILSYLLDITITNELRKNKIAGVTSVQKLYQVMNKCSVGEISIRSTKHRGRKIATPTDLQKKLLELLRCDYLVGEEYVKSIGLEL